MAAGFSALSKTSSHRPRWCRSASTAARTCLGACPGLDAAQRGAQGGELVADQPGLLGIDPPGHVIVVGEPVRVLDRQLGLAHPAHALQRLHHRRVPGQQPVPDRRQQLVPAGEPRVAGRHVPHPQHAVRRQRTRALPCGGQFPQRPFHQPAQLIGAGKGLGDQAAGLHPAAERLLPGPERVINQLRQRDAHISGGGVQHEHQPRQPGRGRGIELQLGVGHLRPVCHRRAVPGAQHPHIHVTAAHPLARTAPQQAGRRRGNRPYPRSRARPQRSPAPPRLCTTSPLRGSCAARRYAKRTPATGHPALQRQPPASSPSATKPARSAPAAIDRSISTRR